MAAKKSTLEQDLNKLDELVKKMDAKDVSLEDSFSIYEEGMKILKGANEKLDEVEKKVKVLQEDGSLTDFDEE